LPLGAFPASYLVAESVVGSQEPFSVPAVLPDGIFHVPDGLPDVGFLIDQVQPAAEVGVLAAVFHEHSRNEHGFRHGAFTGAAGLEALAGFRGEAVQIQAVVPVCTADEGQAVGAQMGSGEADAPADVLHQGGL